MKFLDWLFGEGWDAPADDVKDSASKPKKFRQVPKWTHAGRKGKTIFCPECGKSTHVHNFGWDSLKCTHCGTDVEKYHWLLPVEGD